MDKYYEKALKAWTGSHVGTRAVDVLAAYGRQCAKEAYEDAAKMASDETWKAGCMECHSTRVLEIQYGIKAAALSVGADGKFNNCRRASKKRAARGVGAH